MNLLIRPCLALTLALGTTAPFAQSYTPPAGLDAAGVPGGRIQSSMSAADPIPTGAGRRPARRHADRQAE
ncbi:hypothetical protein ACYQR9_20915 [Methylobacterium sp. CM6241]